MVRFFWSRGIKLLPCFRDRKPKRSLSPTAASVIQQKTEFELIETEISPFALQKSDEIIVLKDACGLTSISQYRKKFLVIVFPDNFGIYFQHM